MMATGAAQEHIPASAGGTTPASPPAFMDTNDDMYDSPEELKGDKLLARGLAILDNVCAPYWEANHQAIELQQRHRQITKWALIAATVTVTVAIGQLPFLNTLDETTKWVLVAAESLAALFALVLVISGLKLAVQKHWLLERHRAERFRFLKYRWLLTLATKSKDDPDLATWTSTARAEALELLKLEEPDLNEWLKEHHRKRRDDESLRPVVPDTDFNEILNYYKNKRLDRQVSYFLDKSESNLRNDWLTRLLPPILFLASLALALLHFGIDIFDAAASALVKSTITWGKSYSVWIITFAALLPVWGAAIRTLRSANEYSRNTVRFLALHIELKGASASLGHYADPAKKLGQLWETEEDLEDEHREWLRLMDEAEWYG